MYIPDHVVKQKELQENFHPNRYPSKNKIVKEAALLVLGSPSWRRHIPPYSRTDVGGHPLANAILWVVVIEHSYNFPAKPIRRNEHSSNSLT